jgi:hypothetical protein
LFSTRFDLLKNRCDVSGCWICAFNYSSA